VQLKCSLIYAIALPLILKDFSTALQSFVFAVTKVISALTRLKTALNCTLGYKSSNSNILIYS